MDPSVLAALLEQLISLNCIGKNVSFHWHSGEQLTIGKSRFETLSSILRSSRYFKDSKINLQTNGTLIDAEWMDLFRRFDVKPAISLDGPPNVHNTHRVNRRGKGTHSEALGGAIQIKDAGWPLDIICVISSISLDHPHELYEFFKEIVPRSVKLNIEEIEGQNTNSSIDLTLRDTRISYFYKVMLERLREDNYPFVVTDFSDGIRLLTGTALPGHVAQQLPGAIISISATGSVSTFSPELVDYTERSRGEHRQPFIYGNILSTKLIDIINSASCKKHAQEISDGVLQCKNTCRDFSKCQGGIPSNKYFENGTFNSRDTLYCNARFKKIFRAIEVFAKMNSTHCDGDTN